MTFIHTHWRTHCCLGQAKSSYRYTGLQARNITALHFCGEQIHSQLTNIVIYSQVSFMVKNKFVTDAVGLDLANKITWSVFGKKNTLSACCKFNTLHRWTQGCKTLPAESPVFLWPISSPDSTLHGLFWTFVSAYFGAFIPHITEWEVLLYHLYAKFDVLTACNLKLLLLLFVHRWMQLACADVVLLSHHKYSDIHQSCS